MVYCSVVGCTSSYNTIPKPKLFRIPVVITNDCRRYQSDPDKHQLVIEISKVRRNSWVRALKRGPFNESQINYMRVCSKHFISGENMRITALLLINALIFNYKKNKWSKGEPAKDIFDVNHPDWAPCINLGYTVGVALKKPEDLDRSFNFVQILTSDRWMTNWPLIRWKAAYNQSNKSKYENPNL